MSSQHPEQHDAWKGDLSLTEVKRTLLGEKSADSYILSKGDDAGSYYMSFVSKDKEVVHADFQYDKKAQRWVHQNGSYFGAENLDALFVNFRDHY